MRKYLLATYVHFYRWVERFMEVAGSVRITRELFVGHGVFFGAFWVFGFNTFPDEGALELGYDIAVI